MIASFPKCGSTFLLHVLSGLPGFERAQLVPATGLREQELDINILRQLDGRSWIGRQHVRASDWTLKLIDQFDLTPVVLVRNIQDAMISLSEHVTRAPKVPFAYFDETFASLSSEEKLRAIVDLTGPWFITFYVSWWHRFPDAFLSYEDVVLGGPERIQAWLERLGIEVSREALAAAIDAARITRTRFNVGVSGRGNAMLPADCKATLQRLASYYREVDFSRIGL